jgi:hypothetical protein
LLPVLVCGFTTAYPAYPSCNSSSVTTQLIVPSICPFQFEPSALHTVLSTGSLQLDKENKATGANPRSGKDNNNLNTFI